MPMRHFTLNATYNHKKNGTNNIKAADRLKILLVKLSSLGDVLHTLPVVYDIKTAYPEAQIDWVETQNNVRILKSELDFMLMSF